MYLFQFIYKISFICYQKKSGKNFDKFFIGMLFEVSMRDRHYVKS